MNLKITSLNVRFRLIILSILLFILSMKPTTIFSTSTDFFNLTVDSNFETTITFKNNQYFRDADWDWTLEDYFDYSKRDDDKEIKEWLTNLMVSVNIDLLRSNKLTFEQLKINHSINWYIFSSIL